MIPPEDFEARAASRDPFPLGCIDYCFYISNRVDRDAVRLASARAAAVDPLRQQAGEGEGDGGKRWRAPRLAAHRGPGVRQVTDNTHTLR